jgi:enamine deaminase RidA (YjgF/YER057c/UK114 family)
MQTFWPPPTECRPPDAGRRYGRAVRPELVRPDGLAEAPYEYAAVAPEARLVFTAGACPVDAEGQIVARGDFEAQARKALDNLFVILAAAGSGPELVLKTTVYVAASERTEVVRVWNLVAEAFGVAKPPSTLLGVSVLGYPEQLVEIEAVALSARA